VFSRDKCTKEITSGQPRFVSGHYASPYFSNKGPKVSMEAYQTLKRGEDRINRGAEGETGLPTRTAKLKSQADVRRELIEVSAKGKRRVISGNEKKESRYSAEYVRQIHITQLLGKSKQLQGITGAKGGMRHSETIIDRVGGQKNTARSKDISTRKEENGGQLITKKRQAMNKGASSTEKKEGET